MSIHASTNFINIEVGSCSLFKLNFNNDLLECCESVQ